MTWDVFICHASEDKDAAARPLAERLKKAGLNPWLDENELTIGDRLSQKIDDGLAQLRYGVVILSRYFFQQRWASSNELPGLFARQAGGQKVILPVWHGVDNDEVLRYSPLLAGLLGTSTGEGLDAVAKAILAAVRKGEPVAGNALPTRDDELHYLKRLIADAEELARRYAPLHGVAKTQARGRNAVGPKPDEADIALLRLRSRKPETEQRDYDDILAAFADVPRAALLGAPGSGKSTTLRKLAVDLAKRAQEDSHAPLPLLAELGNWRREESLAAYLKETAPEIGWAVEALSREGRLVLLLDGLNEMPTATRGAKAKDVRALQNALGGNTALIVSCRGEDYTGEAELHGHCRTGRNPIFDALLRGGNLFEGDGVRGALNRNPQPFFAAHFIASPS